MTHPGLLISANNIQTATTLWYTKRGFYGNRVNSMRIHRLFENVETLFSIFRISKHLKFIHILSFSIKINFIYCRKLLIN